MIIGYIMFESSEAFEQWQREEKPEKIFNIQPVVTGVNMEPTGEGSVGNADATTKVNVFVTYEKTNYSGD